MPKMLDPFSRFDEIPACDRQADRPRTIANTAPAQRRAGHKMNIQIAEVRSHRLRCVALCCGAVRHRNTTQCNAVRNATASDMNDGALKMRDMKMQHKTAAVENAAKSLHGKP